MPNKKLTDVQLRIVMAVAGVLCGAALIASIYLSGSTIAKDNLLFQFLFVIVFIAITFIRRRIEVRFRLRLNFFNLILMDSIIAGILVFLMLPYAQEDVGLLMDENLKLIIVIAISLVLLALGIGLPLWNYFKRKANGTQKPIRLPEEKEEDTEKSDGKSTKRGFFQQRDVAPAPSIAQQIADMNQELGKNKPEIEAAEPDENKVETEDDEEDDG